MNHDKFPTSLDFKLCHPQSWLGRLPILKKIRTVMNIIALSQSEFIISGYNLEMSGHMVACEPVAAIKDRGLISYVVLIHNGTFLITLVHHLAVSRSRYKTTSQ